MNSIQTYAATPIWDGALLRTSLTLANRIDDNLWMGAVPPRIGPPEGFRSILDTYDWDPYRVPVGAERRAHKMHDSKEIPSPYLLNDLADWINERRKVGPVLVHCQMGLNRSGLLTGLALIRSGVDALDAIKQIRANRSNYCLSNKYFEDYLRSLGGYI